MWHKNSSGPNTVPCGTPESTWALSECSPSTTTLIVRFCRNDDGGILPNDWLSANIAPVLKKGDVYAAENYRPISLTCSNIWKTTKY
jgi:hypothetical protein